MVADFVGRSPSVNVMNLRNEGERAFANLNSSEKTLTVLDSLGLYSVRRKKVPV